jgi:predicted phage terminase large subunit-like protein
MAVPPGAVSKTWALLADDLYHIGNPLYRSVTFRRTYPQITNAGGLWDEAFKVYPTKGGKPNQSTMSWNFPSGASVRFAHMQYENDKLQWHGSQIPVLKFDELTHFSESMFFYMLSRNRSTSGIKPYVRASCNADADSWVADLIAWWIDQRTGLPIPERAGVLRYFIRVDGKLIWADSPLDLPWLEIDLDGVMVPQKPKSLTFIPAKVTDNKILIRADPGYISNLMAQDPVERARLLEGNWKTRPAAGLYFKRHWFDLVDAVPTTARPVRSWDFAATLHKAGSDPDWTVGARVSRTPDGIWYIEHVRRLRDTPQMVESAVKQIAFQDGRKVPIHLEQEPGSSGKMVFDHYVREVLPHYAVYPAKNTGSKDERIKPVSAQAQAGNVRVVAGDWNEDFFNEAEQYPDGAHDDILDAIATAFDVLSEPTLPYAWKRVDPLFRAQVLPTESLTPHEQELKKQLESDAVARRIHDYRVSAGEIAPD